MDKTCSWGLELGEMERKIGQTALKTDPFALQFTNLKLTYIPSSNEGDVGFTLPLTLGEGLEIEPVLYFPKIEKTQEEILDLNESNFDEITSI